MSKNLWCNYSVLDYLFKKSGQIYIHIYNILNIKAVIIVVVVITIILFNILFILKININQFTVTI